MKKVLVYGCNGLGKDVVYSLSEKECQVGGILDDYKHLIGGMTMGLMCTLV